MRAVQNFPGVHGRGVAQLSRISAALAFYHLHGLLEQRMVARLKAGNLVHWFPRQRIRGLAPGDRTLMIPLRDVTARRIIELLAEGEPLRHADLMRQVAVQASTLSHHLRRLHESRVIGRDDATRLVYLVEPERARRLIKRWPPLPWQETIDRRSRRPL